jgi:CubicO group peptidase (beta-lactamase class C family)
MTKSVTHALVGILVRQGKLDPAKPGLIKEWTAPGDPRNQITINHLLRMTSGLPQDEFGTPMDPAYELFWLQRDPYELAVRAQPEAPLGARWAYSNFSIHILARLVRDAVGGGTAEVFNFARRELFAPLGMRTAELGYDVTGTPMGACYSYVSARDWARFGLLYLNGGVVDGNEVLPPAWVQAAATPTTDAGYGAAFWLNTTSAPKPRPLKGNWGMPGAPKDAFYAHGGLGQYVVIVPSAQLVVVRLGITWGVGYGVESVGRLVGKVANVVGR